MVEIQNELTDLLPSVLQVNKYTESVYDTFKSVICKYTGNQISK